MKIYYSIVSGGDGSAHPIFFELEKLAELHQDYENENGNGFAEPCTGFIEVESDSPITCLNTITVKQELEEAKSNLKYKCFLSNRKVLEKYIKDLICLADAK